MATTKIDALKVRISKQQEAIARIDEIIADDGASMTDEQLDQVTRESDVAKRRLGGLQAALEGELTKDADAVAKAAQEARKAAAAAVAKAAGEREDAAADIDASISALIASIQRYVTLNNEMRLGSYDAGLRDINARNSATSLSAVSAVLADRLLRSGIGSQLDYLIISGVQHTDASVAELTARINSRLLAQVERKQA